MAQALLIGPGVARSRGFTLIEMMVVVIIVSILAMLAVVALRTIRQSSHVSEATNMVQNIRVAQEGYHSETQQYANITKVSNFPTGATPMLGGLYPAGAGVYNVLSGWGATCSNCNTDWSVLPLHVDGPVLFGYATISNAAPNANTAPVSPLTVNGQSVTVTKPPLSDWFQVAAEADLDGNAATVTDVFGFSWSNQIFVSNEGQ